VRHPIVEIDEPGNGYQHRKLPDGSIHLVLKNFPIQQKIGGAVGTAGEAFKFTPLEHYWLLAYILKKAASNNQIGPTRIMSHNKTLQDFYQHTDASGQVFEPHKALRNTQVASFMRCPQINSFDAADIGIIGIPYDGGLTFQTGARFGPREVRNQSCMMRAINVSTHVEPYELARVGDLGDILLPDIFNHDQAIADICSYYQKLAHSNIIPLSVGGDHSVSYPILKGLQQRFKQPIALVHIDAHTDTWGPFNGSKYHHGAPFRLACDEGLIDPTKTLQIGIRGGQNIWDGLNYSRDQGMHVITIEDFEDMGWRGVSQKVREVVGDSPVYLTFDIDGLDPAYAPGTGTPESGGITMREAQRLLRELRGMNFVGADLVEIAPQIDPTGMTAMNGATLLFEMLCLLAEKVGTDT
jgi:guanidinopropionase